MEERQLDLIYDVGAHHGEDTAFYLAKGFRVVAVEADPDNCDVIRRRFNEQLITGQLTLVTKAIGPHRGSVDFYKCLRHSVWNTLSAEFAARNRSFGYEMRRIEVESINFCEVLAEHGIPYYLKIDIEGMDCLCVEALRDMPARPRYVSIESSKRALSDIAHELDLFCSLGYKDFKIVAQHRVSTQQPPCPAREGTEVDWQFALGDSGLFGEEAPGEWLGYWQTLAAYMPVFVRYHCIGDRPLMRSGRMRGMLERLGFAAGWYDTHARLQP